MESLEDRSTLENNAKKEAYLGQLILQNLYLYPDFKEREICLENEKILLPLQAHSLSHTAQIFFENSKKLAKKAKNIHLQTRNLEEKIFFYQKLLQMIQNVTNLNDLQILDSNLQKKSNIKEAKQKQKFFESFFIEGVKVSIGKNEKENIALLKVAKAEDIWLHIRGIPSSHCIIHSGKSKIPDIIIYKAAQILVGLLKSYGGSYEVDYTKRKFVKILEGAKVVYAKEQTLKAIKE